MLWDVGKTASACYWRGVRPIRPDCRCCQYIYWLYRHSSMSHQVQPPRDTQLQLTRMAYFAGLAPCYEWIRPHNHMPSKLICEIMDLVYQVIRANLSRKHQKFVIVFFRSVYPEMYPAVQSYFNIVLFRHCLHDLLYRHQIWTYRCFWCCSFPSTVHLFTVPCAGFHDPSRGRRSFSVIDKRLANSHSLHHSLILHRGQTECCNSRWSAGRQAAPGRSGSLAQLF